MGAILLTILATAALSGLCIWGVWSTAGRR